MRAGATLGGETSAGAALGYFDVKTGCYHPDAAANLPLLQRAIGSYLAGEVARAFNAKTGERAWRIGADGEEAVAARLAKLGPEWRVLHAVEVGTRGPDIDRECCTKRCHCHLFVQQSRALRGHSATA